MENHRLTFVLWKIWWSESTALWHCSSLMMHRGATFMEYRGSNTEYFLDPTSGMTSIRVQYTFDTHLNSLEAEDLHLSASETCTYAKLFSILKKMGREEMKEAVMESDNIVFVYLEDLNLWHTQNFQKDLTVTEGNRVQMSTTQITGPV